MTDIVERLRNAARLRFSPSEELEDAAAEIERLRAALRLFVGCAYPVATEIKPRGYDWRPEKDLDYALGEARKALRDNEQSAD